MNTTIEIFAAVLGYEKHYQVSNLGRIRRIKTGRGVKKNGIVSGSINKFGYNRIKLSVDDKYKNIFAHRLVAEAFIPNPYNKPQVNHINGIKADNRVENLEWVTSSENVRHSFKIGISSNIGEKNSKCKLLESEVIEIYKSTESILELARRHKMSESGIKDIKRGKNWSYLTNHQPPFKKWVKK